MEQIMKDVSIIIVNYNTSALINDCLKSIYQHTEGVDYEIIIVDNNTEPDLREKLDLIDCVQIINLSENLGFGLANNEGAKYAKGKYVFLLNPDTVLMNNGIKVLFDFMESNPEVGVSAGNLYDEKLNPTLSFKLLLPGLISEINESLFQIPERLFAKNRFFNYSDKPIEVGYVAGADMMIPSKLFKELGGFSSEFFMYYEETDLCCRIRNADTRIFSVPQAKIQHLEGKSFEKTKAVNYNRIKYMQSSRHIYLRRNVGRIQKICCDLVFLIGSFLELLFIPVKDGNYAKYKIYKLKYFFNAYNQYA